MQREADASILTRKGKVRVSKSLNLMKTWNTIGPIVAEHIAGPDYTYIPYLIDTDAYQIGHIFVQGGSQVQCFCVDAQIKILGPIRDFLLPAKTASKWMVADLPVIRSTDDKVDFKVILGNGKHGIAFAALDCYFLDIAPDMKIVGEVTIDRSLHEDLTTAEWFGLITAVVVSGTSEISMKRSRRDRKLSIEEKHHTILFKYAICRMDKAGGVRETSTDGLVWKWLPVTERDMNSLPLTQFVSQPRKLKS